MSKHKYVKVSESSVPGNVRFDQPARFGGQIIEVEFGGFGRAEHDDGDLYRRQRDRSETTEWTYYKRIQDA